MKLVRRTDDCDPAGACELRVQDKRILTMTESGDRSVQVTILAWCDPHNRFVVLEYMGSLERIEKET